MQTPEGITVEADDNLLVVDQGLRAVLRIDPATGDRSVLSDDAQGTGPALLTPTALTCRSNGSVVVADSGLQALVGVDATTGDRLILSDGATGSGPTFQNVVDVIEKLGMGLLAVDAGAQGLLRIDPGSGDRFVISSAARGNGPPFQLPAAVTVLGQFDLDLVTANLNSDNVGVFFQTSPGAFGNAPDVLGDVAMNNTISVATGDLNGDGAIDIISANSLSSNLAVFLQTAPGTFATPPLFLSHASVVGPVSVVVADVDGDTDLDICSANSDSSNIAIFEQTAPGIFGAVPHLISDASMSGPQSLAAVDCNQDQNLDLVTANGTSSNITVFFQTSPLVFSTPPLVLSDAAINAAISVIGADLNDDQVTDLASANFLSNTVTIFFQTSPGVFNATPTILSDVAMTMPRSVEVKDLNQDGKNDVATANVGTNNLTVFLQTSAGVFGSPIIVSDVGALGPRAVRAADLDGDLDNDLVSANFDSSNVMIKLQTAPGTFSGGATLLSDPTLIRPFHVTLADLDGTCKLVVADAGLRALIQVDPASGDRTLLSGDTQGNGPFFALPAAVGTTDSGNLLVMDAGIPALFQVDPDSGDRLVISNGAGSGPDFLNPEAFAEEAAGTLVVVDRARAAVLRIDPSNGDRSLLSGQGPSVAVSPPTGKFVQTQSFDLAVILDAAGLSVVSGSAVMDSADITATFVSCVQPGTLVSGGSTFRCPGLMVGSLGPGEHTFTITLNLSDGSQVSDTAVWTVLESREP